MLNVAATVVWEDIFKMFRPAREASDKIATIATKFLGKQFLICYEVVIYTHCIWPFKFLSKRCNGGKLL